MFRLLENDDPTTPDADDCVLARVLERSALATPTRPLLELQDGTVLSCADLLAAGRRTARGLQQLGVRRGDRVVCWLPNGIEGVRTLVATSMLGAVFVGLNTAYRGDLLQHALERAEAQVAVVHRSLIDRLDSINRGRVTTVVCVGARENPHAGCLDWEVLDVDGALDDDGSVTQPWDDFVVLFTSGTTGPSKAVLSSYVHHYSFLLGAPPVFRSGDRTLYQSPLFHITGTAGLVDAVLSQYTLVLTSGFTTDSFWDLVRDRAIDSTFFFAPMASFLLQEPPSSTDRDHPLRRIVMSPLTPDAIEFCRRFGVELYTAYAMSELATPIVSGPNPDQVGSCGSLRPGVEGRLVDGNDIPVAPGEVGELILHPTRPWSFSHGYSGDPAATAATWRNGWFHTGDLFRRDDQGVFFFVDRAKDAIRRRGENISSFEVETAVLAHDAVSEVAAVGVESGIGEEDVLVAVVVRAGHTLDPVELIEFLVPRMAYYMVPRYIRVVDSLPVTASARVRKHLLRDEGVTSNTWDRHAAGIRLRRERFDDGLGEDL